MPHLEKKSKSDVAGFIKFLILLSVAIFFVTSCVSQKDVVYLNKQVNALYRQTKNDGKRFEKSIKKLKKLPNEAMEAEIPMWGGTRQRKEGLFAYIGEVYHHKGQVTYIRGTYKRLNE